MDEFIKDCDKRQLYWVEIALGYLPAEIIIKESKNIAIIAVGEIAACRLPLNFRMREIIFLADWIFPPAQTLESEEPAQAFIFTVLHEIAHIVFQHKSPQLLTSDQNLSQEEEANLLAQKWFNNHVESKLGKIEPLDLVKIKKHETLYSEVYDKFQLEKEGWYKNDEKWLSS